MMENGRFADRREAGRELAQAVEGLALQRPVVLGLPRGGVPVAYEVAKALGAPLDVLIVRKIGAPGHEEYGIGALVDGNPPQAVIDQEAAAAVGATRQYLDFQIARQLAEIERRRMLYGAGPRLGIEGRTAVLVDDGIATGGTVRAALRGLARESASGIVLAVPTAPAEILREMPDYCDSVVCLSSPRPFRAVGMHYRDFEQIEDSEVVQLLEAARSRAIGPREAAV